MNPVLTSLSNHRVLVLVIVIIFLLVVLPVLIPQFTRPR
jgi:hypothetical protein